jgi:hypothetical protein
MAQFQVTLCTVTSLALVVAHSALAQTQVVPGRVGTQITNPRSGNQAPGMNRPWQYSSGRGQGLGDGNVLGGQTFSWLRSSGSGQVFGSGNSLDANPQVGSGGANRGSVPVDFGARNLVVTGSVPGGRQFRGSVGYTADTDFRAPVGSDDTYLYRADSAFSNPSFATMSVARDRFFVAQGLGVFEYRRDSTVMPFTANAGTDQPDSRLRLDRANADMSFSRANWDIGKDRTIATSSTQKGEPLRYVISPLRGLQIEQLSDPMARAGMSVYERARARQDIAAGLATMEDYSRIRVGMGMDAPDPRRVDRRLKAEPTAGSTKVDPSKVLPKSYLDIVDAVNKSADGAMPGEKPTDKPIGGDKPKQPKTQLDLIREAVKKFDEDTATESKPNQTKQPGSIPTERPTTVPNTDATKSATGGAKQDAQGGSLVAPDGAPRSGEAQREAERVKERGELISVQEAAQVLRHGRTVSELGRDDKRRVDELVKQGEAALRSGDYFVAERRFEQAQSLAADNPLTEVGIAHSQLGSGLYLSASLTLRNLFESFPELIDTRYDRALLPAQDRLDRALGIIRERAFRGDDVPSYGLLIAYIGHQLSDRKMVEEGLSLLRGTEKLDKSRELLGAVWLGAEPANKPESTPAPAPGSK